MESNAMWSSKARAALIGFVFAALAGVPASSQAALDIAQAPLFVSVPIDPNLMFVMDDSGSMHWETIPDQITQNTFGGSWTHRSVMYVFPMRQSTDTPSGVEYADCIYSAGTGAGCDYWRSSTYRGENLHQVPRFEASNRWAAFFRSSHNNLMYYNPTIRYRPWVKSDGTYWPDAAATKAFHNPQRESKGWRNLTISNTQRACWIEHAASTSSTNAQLCTTANETFYPATYFRYNGVGDVQEAGSYTRVEIRSGSTYAGGPARTDCANPSACTYAEEIRNFANWYTYHRSRILASQAGIGAAFAMLPTRMRVGFGTINKVAGPVDGESTPTIIRGVRSFTGTDREQFFDLLYGHEWPLAGTPLRRALDDAGQYFSRTDARGPWSSTPGQTGGDDLACRQSFTVLMTDGAWNGDQASTVGARANNDGTDGPTITGPDGATYTYSAKSPFTDSTSNTLADVAMYYWKNDLHTGLANRVPASPLNPAFWQHMVTFGVGLGVHGNIDPDQAFAAIGTGATITWPAVDADASSEAKLDDLLHASVNSRGGFFSAGDPGTFAEGLVNVLRDVIARTGAVTGLSVASTRLTEGSSVYAAEFSSEDWSGDLRALEAMPPFARKWSAAERIADLGHAARKIFTWTGSGSEFDSSLPTATKQRLVAPLGLDPAATLAVADRIIAYVRGDQSHEQSAGGSYRDRSSLLGDIVNARPHRSGRGNEGWARLPVAQGGGASGAGSYGHYINQVKRDARDCVGEPGCAGDRYDTVFVGANDGMLHAFDARTGNEMFAYVPSAVHHKLHRLTDPNYSHTYFVDGDVTVADARLGGQWRTVLVGTLGAGGRGVYALDVTRPQNFDKNQVLWEFTAEDDADLGFTFGEPAITRLADGTWVAIVGNGYNSQNERNWLYVLNLATGAVLHKLALGTATGTGLSGVAVMLDPETRSRVERAYVGDLRGTVWRVDFDGSTPSLKFASGLFTDPAGQAVTARPTLAVSPKGGVMVYIGTGKLIEPSDRTLSSPPLERFWMLHDKESALPNNNLNKFSQILLSDVGGGRREASSPDGIGELGCYVNLRVSDTAAGNRGERVLDRAQVIFGKVAFSTYEPLEDPCTPGGAQRVYLLDAMCGGGGGWQIGTGAPLNPPIVIRPAPRVPGNPGELDPDQRDDPPDPDNPPDPDEPGGPPPGAVGSRSAWCEQFSHALGATSLGVVCPGRQVWRQSR
jgi:type IV pilus assembly protein PilY1